MKRKIFGIIVTLLMCSSAIMIILSDFKVEASPGGGNGEIGESIGLDLDFMWDVTRKLCNATYEAYNEGEIRKGRDFGTKGDHWTADYLNHTMNVTLGLENVTKIKIEPIDGMDCWKYNYKVDVIDFNLTINGDNYSYPHIVPKNETYTLPTGTKNNLPPFWSEDYLKIDYNHSLVNLSIVPLNLSLGPISGFNISYLNVSLNNSITEITDFLGNTTYIPFNESIPNDQECRLYLLEEEDGVEYQLENITNNMSLVILIHNTSRNDSHIADTSNCNFSIGRINDSADNLATVIELLQNETIMVANNIHHGNETFTFNYDLICDDWPWGSEDFFYVSGYGLYDYFQIIKNTLNISIRNVIKYRLGGAICHGIIGYDISNDTHLMWGPRRHWKGWNNSGIPKGERKSFNQLSPTLQMFLVNQSVGKWLENNYSHPNTSVSGYFEQADNWVDAYNVIGNISIDHSPNDNITVISNRYDGWWSEAPGDSGAGAGIVLGIAKYFTDYEIKPKCNLSFLFTTGEEWGFRGAWHYSHSHPEDEYNIVQWIGTDQLGFNESGSFMNPLLSDNTTTGDIIEAIANETDYESRTGYGFRRQEAKGGTDDFAIRGRKVEKCNTICIHKTKENPRWFGHHRTGMNFQEGDSLNYQDRNDLNVTFEYAWNITKYFTVNPDCWIESQSWNTSDSDDNGNLNDTITADFNTRSILPHDLAMVKFTLLRFPVSPVMSKYMNFSVNRSTNSKSINITLPANEPAGFYRYKIDLYNSTGRINEIVGLSGNKINQTKFSKMFFLHPYNYSAIPPEITNVTHSPETVGYGFNVTINADVTSNVTSIDTVTVNISYPDDSIYNYSMSNTVGDTYEFVFNDTWQHGQYDYVIWANTSYGVENGSSQQSFNVSANATISVCTIKDSYGDNETVNLTDPPGDIGLSQQIGYELLDDNKVLRIWNKFDNYYFNTSNGIQFTNHYQKYWSHNVLMLGYYNNDIWNLIYRSDNLSGFNKNIVSDNETFVNATLWKDLSYGGYDFRLAIRYYLGAFDNELTVIPYIKNIDDEDIPYVLGFAWEIKDIKIGMTPGGDYIDINGTTYFLNEEDLDETYKNMFVPCFYIREDISGDESQSLYLRWNENLNYVVRVKSRDSQYNAPVILGIKIGTLDVGQEKYTSLFWHDAFEKVYYFDSYESGGPKEWATNPGYMVDGNISTYASTAINLDLERCNNNTCNGTDLGTITKVEIRCRGYHAIGWCQADIILRPIFNAKPGDDHTFVTSTSGSWSQWFEITDDTNAPTKWIWNDIEDLFCDVVAQKDPMGPPTFMLYCSKVEVRVTYNVGPVVSNPYPANGSTGVSIAPMLSVNVYDADNDLMNITWLSNSSGSWQTFGSNNSVQTGTYYQTMSNASVNGKWWYWRVNVSDGTNYTLSNVFKFYTGEKSMIENTGSTNFSGYLLMRIDYLNTSSSSWVVEQVVVNETTPRIINVDGVLALDTIFNAQSVNTSSFQNGNGTYCVYACFRDPDGNVLYSESGGSSMGGGSLAAVYVFTVSVG